MKLLIEIPDKLYNFVKNKTIAGNSRNFDGYDMYDVSRCIANGTPLDSVLGEIKAEIVTEGDRVVGEGEYFTGFHLGMICALKIIDKYKAESEERK